MEIPASLTVTQVFEVCDKIVLWHWNAKSILQTDRYFVGKSYMVVMVLVCLVNCISFSIISLHQECCPYMLLQNNWWNQVSPFWHDTDNGIKISIHIIPRSRHNPRTDHGTMLIDDLPQNFQMAHGINMNDVIYHYEWKCQSAWQLHPVFEVCDTIVISYDIILCYGIGMQSQLFERCHQVFCSTL